MKRISTLRGSSDKLPYFRSFEMPVSNVKAATNLLRLQIHANTMTITM
jgi:hypothetical protein